LRLPAFATTRLHPPPIIYGMLFVLTLICSFLAGYDMGAESTRSWVHMLGFALILGIAVYVIVDLEFPRLGLIRLDSFDQLLGTCGRRCVRDGSHASAEGYHDASISSNDAPSLSLAWTPCSRPKSRISPFHPAAFCPTTTGSSSASAKGWREGAFVARTDDAGAGWYNPAGLALSEKSGLNASSNAYELTTITLEGIGQAKGSTRFSPSGTYFGAVLGAPIIKNPNVRLAFFYAKPVSWTPGTLDGAFTVNSGGNEEQFSYTSPRTSAPSFPDSQPASASGRNSALGRARGSA
jgi:hypothetical protein